VTRQPGAMVVAAQPEAVESGAEMLRMGGNAVDAAIAAAFTAGVVDPQMCGIAGFGSLQVRMPDRGVHGCIDFHGKSPSATRPDQWEHLIEGETRDGFGFILRGNVNDVGYQSITTPGSLLAYFEAQTNWGELDWADVVAPAIQWAERGFAVRPAMHAFWNESQTLGRVDAVRRLSFSEAGRRLYFRSDGSLKRIGDAIVNPELAGSLRLIAKGGADVFYRGELAERMAADMAANEALLSAEDLAAYATTHNDPLVGTYRDRLVATNNPPGGGVMLLQMLNTLENFELVDLGHNTADYIQTVTEAMKLATADKDSHIGDPAFVDVPVDRLTSKQYARELSDRIVRGDRAKVERVGPEHNNTTHVCAIDKHGNAVTMTHSLGMPSGVMTPGLGFMFNGCMGVFDPRPGRPGSLAPGKSRFSSLCPTIVTREGSLDLVLGAPGGTQISMGVLQTILNSVDFEMSILESVCAPRVSGTSNAIDVSNRISWAVTDEIEKRGYEVLRSALSYAFSRVHAIENRSGTLRGAADPGGDGAVAVVI